VRIQIYHRSGGASLPGASRRAEDTTIAQTSKNVLFESLCKAGLNIVQLFHDRHPVFVAMDEL
jgi:hypothetical protein